jgi:hypothetical protein
VQHQRGVAAQQARGVDAQRQVALVACGILVVPETLHCVLFLFSVVHSLRQQGTLPLLCCGIFARWAQIPQYKGDGNRSTKGEAESTHSTA